MSIPILSTKLYSPSVRPDWVPRQRLIKRLDQGLRRKLTLVSAPAGYGKTTLISSWVHGLNERSQTTPRTGWLSLEDDENDLVRFMSYFVAACQTIDRSIGQTVLPLLDMPQLPSANHLMTLLINDLTNLPEQSVLVLNDYHSIHHPDITIAVAYFLEHLPTHFHLIVATREEPHLPVARLRVQGQITEIRLDELRFTVEETTAFFNQTMGIRLNDEDIATLETRTEGWIAGLQMAALSLRSGQPWRSGLGSMPLKVDEFGGTHHYVMDYLAAEVVRQQSKEIRAFLRQTAILDRLNASLCDAVTGQPNSQHFLAQLEKANLFLLQLDDQRQWYRYHSLFADFLRTELADWELRQLHQRASTWYEAHGFVPEAIKHALAAQDLTSAQRLIRNSVEETFSQGGFSTLLGWLNALPDEFIRARSDLSAYKGWILYLRGEIAEAEQYAMAAVETQRADDPPVQRGMLLGFRAYLAINRGQAAEAVKYGQEALALLGSTRSFFRTTALSHLGQAQRLVGDRQAAIQTLRQAVSLGQQLNHDLITMEALGYLTLLLYQQGELREALLLCEQAVNQHADALGRPLPVVGLVCIPLGALYFEIDDLERAEHFLTTGIALCQQMGTIYFTLAGQRLLAKLHYVRGEIDRAWEILTAARHLAAQSENERRIRMVKAVIAELQLQQRQIAEAARTLADLPEAAEARSEQENSAIARLLLAQNQGETAHRLLCQLEQTAQSQGRFGSLISIFVLKGLVENTLHQFSDPDPLEQAISLGAQLGYRRTFLNEGTALSALLTKRRNRAPEFVDSLLEALHKLPVHAPTVSPPAAAQNQALVEPLSDAQLTILGLVADGLSNQEIANKLSITVGTTKWHLNQIYNILNVTSRTQAVAQAHRLNLL